MRYTQLLFCTLFFWSFAFADPFYPQETKEQTVETTENLAKNSEEQTACPIPDTSNAVAFNGQFNELTLVGIVKIDEMFSALFIDSKQQLLALKQGDVLAEAQVQITQIDLKSLQYQQWQNCAPSRLATLKL